MSETETEAEDRRTDEAIHNWVKHEILPIADGENRALAERAVSNYERAREAEEMNT